MRSDEQFAREYSRLERIVVECVRLAGPYAHTALDPVSLDRVDEVAKRAGAALAALYWASEDEAPGMPVSRFLTSEMELHGR